MGIPVIIMGESGSGKSTSIRTLVKEQQVGIFNVSGKQLPFRSPPKTIKTKDWRYICHKLKEAKLKSYVIDDAQYIMAFEMFDNIDVKGYDKFSAMASHFFSIVQTVLNDTPDDCIVYFMMHVETGEGGKRKAKTLGKMIDSTLTLEGLFPIVLMCDVDGEDHVFCTQSDGRSTAKSPEGMFEEKSIPNDLLLVERAIREYWGLN